MMITVIIIIIANVNVIVIIDKVVIIIEFSPSRHDIQTLIQQSFVNRKKPSGVYHPNLPLHIVFVEQQSSSSVGLSKGSHFGLSEGSL